LLIFSKTGFVLSSCEVFYHNKITFLIGQCSTKAEIDFPAMSKLSTVELYYKPGAFASFIICNRFCCPSGRNQTKGRQRETNASETQSMNTALDNYKVGLVNRKA
jgi:hypothetical protein